LGGSKGSTFKKVKNTFIIFIVSGFWHGANWTFIIWGFINALYFLPLLLSNNNRKNLDIVAKGKVLPSFREFVSILSTFCLTTLAWIFFRSKSLSAAILYLQRMFTKSLFSIPKFEDTMMALVTISFVALLVIIEWSGRENNYGIEKFALQKSSTMRWTFYLLIVFAIMIYGGKQQEFIYFQF
jgi:D-alanyl-lipoteichoic acid acyltransferase DltB (MBOAT superfamily)